MWHELATGSPCPSSSSFSSSSSMFPISSEDENENKSNGASPTGGSRPAGRPCRGGPREDEDEHDRRRSDAVSFPQKLRHGFRARFHVQFLVNAADVVPHGMDAHAELIGNLLV